MKINEVMSQINVGTWTGDHALVYQTWLKSLIGHTSLLRGVPAAVAYRQHRRVIQRLIEGGEIIAVTLKDDPDFILGYAVAGSEGGIGVVHYVYVKKVYQRIGVAAVLLAAVRERFHIDQRAPMMASHWTDKGSERLKGFGLVYNPYLLIGEKAREVEIFRAG